MDISSLPMLFHVDPSDGLCTWNNTDTMDQSQFDVSDYAAPISGPGCEVETGRVPVPTNTSGIFNVDNIADTAYIADGSNVQDSLQLGQSDELEITLVSNTADLCDDLHLILGMPDMCDVTFLVGKNKEPVHGVKAILAARSKFFHQLIMSQQNSANTTAPKVQKKKSFLMRLFRIGRKRSYKKMRTGSMTLEPRKLEISVEDFDADVFRRVNLFIHSGKVNVNITSAIGVMNAADVYGLPCLRSACFEFAQSYIALNTVLPLLVSTESYSQFKWTRILAQKILEFISDRAEDVLILPDFENLPRSTAVMVLLRPALKARAESKWDTALKWSRRYCQNKGNSYFRRTIKIFIHRINFQDIPATKLEKEVRPLSVVSDDVIDEAIASQVVCRRVIGQESRSTVAPPKPPRKKKVAGKLRRSGVSAAAILAPIRRGFVHINSVSYKVSRRSCVLDRGFISLLCESS